MFKLIEKTIPVITSSAFIILIIRMITKFMNPHLQPKNTQHLLPFFLSFIVALTTACTKHNQEQKADASDQNEAQVKFFCGTSIYDNGSSLPATIVDNSKQGKPLTVIYWNPNNNYFGKEWSPQKRCTEVSKRFQTIYERNQLKYMTADIASWISDREVRVVCSVKEQGARCEEDDLLFTLETKDDPNEVLKNMVAFREEPLNNKPLLRGEKAPTSFQEGKRVYYNLEKALQESSAKQKAPSAPAF